MTVSFEKRVSVSSNILVKELQGEAVILNLDSEEYFGLDEVGASMWKHLTSSRTIQEACETLLDEYDVDPGALRRDLEALVDRLLDLGLIVVADD